MPGSVTTSEERRLDLCRPGTGGKDLSQAGRYTEVASHLERDRGMTLMGLFQQGRQIIGDMSSGVQKIWNGDDFFSPFGHTRINCFWDGWFIAFHEADLNQVKNAARFDLFHHPKHIFVCGWPRRTVDQN